MKILKKKNWPFVLLKLIVLGIVILALLQNAKKTASSYSAGINEAQEILEEEKLSFTVKDVDNIVSEVTPIIEKYAKKRFEKYPKIKIVSKEELYKVCIADLIPQLNRVMKDKSESQLLEIASYKSRTMSKHIMGKYGFLDKILYLVPENINSFIKLNDAKQRSFKPLLKLIIAHELTHVLQDQEIDIVAKFHNLNSFEEMEALNATIEGHALFLQEQVRKHLKLSNSTISFNNSQRKDSINYGYNVTELKHKIEKVWLSEIYLRGMHFIEYYHTKGGSEKVWKVLSQPPTNTSMILKPETYIVQKLKKINYLDVLVGLEKFFGDKKWVVENVDVPKIQLRSAFLALNLNDVDEIISNICHMQTLSIWSKSDYYGSISIIRVKNKSYRSKLLLILEIIINSNLDRMKQSPNYTIQNLLPENFIGTYGNVLRKVSFRVKLKNGKLQNIATVFSSRGDIILEINDQNGKLTDDKFIKISDKIFRRYNEAKAQLEGSHS